jgi:hypothetical protein
MSYDLHLIPARAGTPPLSAARALIEQDEGEINPGPAVPEKEARKARLADALKRANPQLVAFEFGYSTIAAQEGISEAEARQRYRHIELNGPEDGSGVQITLTDDTVHVAVPYRHQPPAAAAVFEEVWQYLAVLDRQGRFAVYDPQLDRILTLVTDRPAVLECYVSVMARMAQEAAPTEKRTRPWWRFW